MLDLDDVLLSQATYYAWQKLAESAFPAAGILGVTDPSQIPDEQIRVNTDGTLTIFVTLPKGEISMVVPVSHWAYREQH